MRSTATSWRGWRSRSYAATPIAWPPRCSDWARRAHGSDRDRLRDDLAELLDRYSSRGPGKLDFGTVSGEILEIVRRHRLRPPRELVLLLKAFVMNEGMAEQLDPDFRLAEQLRPYVYRHLVAELSPDALARRARQAGVDLGELAV